MHFYSPQFLWFLLIIPIYFGAIFYQKKLSKNKIVNAIQISVFEDLKKSQKKSFLQYLPFVQKFLIIILLLFFIITLARPQDEHEKQDMSKKGIDIIIALDVSESMLAEDLNPNRMESAKQSLNSFVEHIENDRLGVIVFSGQAFTQSPLTFDYNILKEYIDRISTETINQQVRGLSGTAVGDAILAAINRFKKSEDRSKVLILLTDGDANRGVDPILAAKKASSEGIKIYAVGIGKEGGAPLPIIDGFGRKQYARNFDGSLFMTTFNEESLKQVAMIGGGKYFRVGDNVSFKKVLDEINKLEKHDIKINVSTEYTENFMKFLVALSVIFLFYLMSISLRIIYI